MKTLFCLVLFSALATAPGLYASGSGSAGSNGQPVVKDESPAVTVYNRGVDLLKQKQFSTAQQAFAKAVSLDPNFAEAYNNLAFTLRKNGHFEESLKDYNRALQLKPNLAEAYMYRGVLYMQMGRKQEAMNDLATLKKLRSPLAKELAEFMESGKEDDELYGAVKKI
jgi:Flp pilus assembly protein TadD